MYRIVIQAACGAVIFDHPYNDGDARAVLVARVCFAIADSGAPPSVTPAQGAMQYVRWEALVSAQDAAWVLIRRGG